MIHGQGKIFPVTLNFTLTLCHWKILMDMCLRLITMSIMKIILNINNHPKMKVLFGLRTSNCAFLNGSHYFCLMERACDSLYQGLDNLAYCSGQWTYSHFG